MPINEVLAALSTSRHEMSISAQRDVVCIICVQCIEKMKKFHPNLCSQCNKHCMCDFMSYKYGAKT